MAKSERELRQLRLMRDRLDGFLAGTLGIGETISDLEGLLGALEEAPETWRRAFQDEWGTLEIAYAIALDNGGLNLPDASVPELKDAAEKMLAMVNAETELAAG